MVDRVADEPPVDSGMLTDPVPKGLLTPVEIAPLLPVPNGTPPVPVATLEVAVAVAMLKKAGNLPAGLTPRTIPLWQWEALTVWAQ